jgi:hypothetical protein
LEPHHLPVLRLYLLLAHHLELEPHHLPALPLYLLLAHHLE